MNVSEYFQVVGDYAVVRPMVECTLEEARDLITAAIEMAQDKQVRKLMFVSTGMTGFKPPSIVDRYFFVKEWAKAGRGEVRVAMVARREMIDPQKFGVIAARNAGLICDVFETEAEAIAWFEQKAP